MNANKWGMRITGTLGIISLIASIVFTQKECTWWINFSFSIFGSSIISFAICWINYLCISKNLMRDILNSIYNINQKGYSQLYSKNGDLSLEEIQKVLGTVICETNNAYNLTLEQENGLILFSRRKEEFLILEIMLKNNLESFQSVCFFIEYNKDDAEKNTLKIYQYLDKKISETKTYKYALGIAKKYFKNIYSLEEKDNIDKLKREVAERFKEEMENEKK